jgi:hypothetical protein
MLKTKVCLQQTDKKTLFFYHKIPLLASIFPYVKLGEDGRPSKDGRRAN